MIIGHQTQLNFLHSALRAGRLSHAYLFTGPEGIGKRLVAEQLGRLLLCFDRKDNKPCGVCVNCRLSLEQHPNAEIVSAEGLIKIDQIRGLKRFFQLKPFSGSARVAILNNVHQVTQEAANAFLKLLEEPPQDSYFFLIASSLDQLPQTIVSRCVPVRFSQVSKTELWGWLQKDYKLNKSESERIAKLSFGRPAWAQLWLQQGEEQLKKMVKIIEGKEVFQWQDWDKEEGFVLAMLSQLGVHLLLQEQTAPFEKLALIGRGLLEAEAVVARTNVSPRLAWENVFWTWR